MVIILNWVWLCIINLFGIVKSFDFFLLIWFFFGNCFVSETSSGDEEGNGERWVEVISWEPRAVVYHNFLVISCFSLI